MPAEVTGTRLYWKRPGRIRVAEKTWKSVTLDWTKFLHVALSFSVQRSGTRSSGYEEIYAAGAEERSYTDDWLFEDTLYFYRVVGLNAQGLPVTSDTVAVRTPLLDWQEDFGDTASAAYSLEELNGMGRGEVVESEATYEDPVVRLLRTSDLAYKSFLPSEIGTVGDSAVEDWCNEEVDTYESDFSSGVDGWSVAGGTRDGNIDGIGGEDDCLRLTVNDADASHLLIRSSFVNGLTYRVTLRAYCPSSNSDANGIAIANTFGQLKDSTSILDEWVTLEATFIANNIYLRIYALKDGGITFQDVGGDDVIYVKDIVVTQLTADGLVHTLYDQSGNGRDATQSTQANMPKLVDAGVLQVDENGNAAPKFDGADDYLSAGNHSAFDFSSDFAVVTIIRANSGDSETYRCIVGKYVTNKGWDAILINGKLRFAVRGTNTIDGTASEDIRDDTFRIAAFVGKLDRVQIYENGIDTPIREQLGTWTPVAADANAMTIGARNIQMPFNGYISAVILLSDIDNLTHVFTALARKYGITLSE